MHLTRTQHRRGVLRLLTLACFFHFAGLNNGFSFILSVPNLPAGEAVQPISFAPVFVAGICRIANPFAWKSVFSIRRINTIFFTSSRVLEISCQNALRKFQPSVNIRPLLSPKTLIPAFSLTGRRGAADADGGKPREGFLLRSSDRLNILDARQNIAAKRTDGRDPEKRPEFDLIPFSLQNIPAPESILKLNRLYQTQASLPNALMNHLWRHALGAGGDPASAAGRPAGLPLYRSTPDD